MNNIFKYIFIGFIQGITEFLPISSSGHIVIFGSMLNISDLMSISIFAHLGTLFAVLYCYRKTIFDLIKKPINKTNINLILATIPTVVFVLIFHNLIDQSFTIQTLIWGFLLSAVLLTVADLIKDKNKPISWQRSLIMGLGQSLAIFPGLSRSGTTLAFGIISGAERKSAVDFSFLMSIPVIIGSVFYEAIKLINGSILFPIYAIILVTISSFVFGILSIKIMLKLMRKNKLYFFAIYLIILSLVVALIC